MPISASYSASRSKSLFTKQCIVGTYAFILTFLLLALLFVPAFQDMATNFTRRHIASHRHEYIHSLHRNSIQTQIMLRAALDIGIFDHLSSVSDSSETNKNENVRHFLSVNEIASDLDLDFQTLHVCIANLVAMDLLDVHVGNRARRITSRSHVHQSSSTKPFPGEQLVSLSKIAQTYLVSPEQRFSNAVASFTASIENRNLFLRKRADLFSFLTAKEDDGDENVDENSLPKKRIMTRDEMVRKQKHDEMISDLSLIDLVDPEHHFYVGNLFTASDGNNFGFLEKITSAEDHHHQERRRYEILKKRLAPKESLKKPVVVVNNRNNNFFFTDAVMSFDALQKLFMKKLLPRSSSSPLEMNSNNVNEIVSRFSKHQPQKNGQNTKQQSRREEDEKSAFLNILHVSTEYASPAFGAIILDQVEQAKTTFFINRQRKTVTNADNDEENRKSKDNIEGSIKKHFASSRADKILKRGEFIFGNLTADAKKENNNNFDRQYELVVASPNFFQNVCFDPDQVVEMAIGLLNATKPGGAICIIETLKQQQHHEKLPSVTEKSDDYGHYSRSLELALMKTNDDENENVASAFGRVYSSGMFKQLLIKAGWIRVEMMTFVEPKTHTVIIARKGLI